MTNPRSLVSDATIKIYSRPGGVYSAVGRIVIGGRPFYVAASTSVQEICDQLIEDFTVAQNFAVASGDYDAAIGWNPFKWAVDAVKNTAKGVAAVVTNPLKAAKGVVGDTAKFVQKGVKAIAESKLVREVAKGLDKIIESPIVAGIVGVAAIAIPGVGTTIGLTYAAVRAAHKAAKAVLAGDPKAIAGIAEVAGAAIDNPIAQQATALVAQAVRAPQEIKDKVLGVVRQGADTLTKSVLPGLTKGLEAGVEAYTHA